MSFTIHTHIDSNHNTISYLFNPSKRESDGAGPVVLDQLITTYEADASSPPPVANEPKPGTVLLRYTARDGGDVRYIYDPTARNGKQYVVAIHREPENWQRLREEDLAVEDEEGLRRMYEEKFSDVAEDDVWEQGPEQEGRWAREQTEDVGKESPEQEWWTRERTENRETRKRRDSIIDDPMMDVEME